MRLKTPIITLRERFGSVRIERYALFLLSMMLFGLAVGLFNGVKDNYLAWLGVGRAGRGVVEFVRELPGLLLFLMLAPFYRMAERRIIRIALAVSAAGLAGFLVMGDVLVPAVVSLVIWSAGEHLIMPVRRSYAVHSAVPGREGAALGLMLGVENAGQVIGLAVVPLVFVTGLVRADRDGGGRLGFVIVFIAAGLALLAAFSVSLGMSGTNGSLERKRFHMHRKFVRYYGLEMFYGARKQVFLTFGPYLLILHYGVQTEYMASLLGLCALLNIFFTPLIGRIIDRAGYRSVMVGDTIILAAVCLAYGFAHRIFDERTALAVVSANFVLDWIISNASMASSVYVGRISDGKEEMASTMSTGISINHLVGILIALAGGFIWERVGVELLFVVAALMAVGNTVFALTIPKMDPRPVQS